MICLEEEEEEKEKEGNTSKNIRRRFEV